MNFDTTLSSDQIADVILVGEGAALPEPGSVLLLGSALLLMGVIAVGPRRWLA